MKCWISSFGENAVTRNSSAAATPTSANLPATAVVAPSARRGSTGAAATGAGAAETCTGGGGHGLLAVPHDGHRPLHDVVEVEDELRRPCPGSAA